MWGGGGGGKTELNGMQRLWDIMDVRTVFPNSGSHYDNYPQCVLLFFPRRHVPVVTIINIEIE